MQADVARPVEPSGAGVNSSTDSKPVAPARFGYDLEHGIPMPPDARVQTSVLIRAGMKSFSTSMDRLRLPFVVWQGGAAIAALLAIALLLVAVGIVGHGGRPDWATPRPSQSNGRAGWAGLRRLEHPNSGDVNRSAHEAALLANQGSDLTGGFATESGAHESERPPGTERFHPGSSANADASLFSALERLERKIAAAMGHARVGRRARVHGG